MIVSCPACEGPGLLLGALGKLLWFRCRHCGVEFSVKEEKHESQSG